MTPNRAIEPFPIEFDEANCRKLGLLATDTMYPDEDDPQAVAIAKSVCDGCVVVELCRDRAVKNNEQHGVWGGMTQRERSNFQRKVYREKKRRRDGWQ